MSRTSKCGFIFACVAALLLSFGCEQDAEPEVQTEEGRPKRVYPENGGNKGNEGTEETEGTGEPEETEKTEKTEGDETGETEVTAVQKVSLDGSVTLSGLSGNDVFLVKVNTSSEVKNASIAPSGFADGEQVMDVPAGVITIDGKTLTRYERHWQVQLPAASMPLTSQRLASVYTAAQTVGATKDFFVDLSPTSETFTEKRATLKIIGTHCKVWVVNEYFNAASPANGTDGKVNLDQLQALADKFDAIYPLETALLGYEYGGGPGGNGGADGDPKIQILVFDIDGDVNDSSRTGITLGYFYSGDEYPNIPIINGNSNKAEIFYLDSEMLDKKPDTIYSTLIHEFNHMINYNIKAIQKQTFSVTTWYTEMLSMLAEDVIGPLVGIPYTPGTANGNVITARIHLRWLSTYFNSSVMYWDKDNTLNSYAANYAFGAYLVRNFGGPALLHEIATSPLDGKASLDDALQKLNPQINGQNVDTDYALSRFGEALVYSGDNMPAGVLSFDKTVSATVEGELYTFPRFNIWDMEYTDQEMNYYRGPVFFEYDQAAYTIPPKAVQLFSHESWLNVSGPLTIQVQNGNSDIDYYVMIK